MTSERFSYKLDQPSQAAHQEHPTASTGVYLAILGAVLRSPKPFAGTGNNPASKPSTCLHSRVLTDERNIPHVVENVYMFCHAAIVPIALNLICLLLIARKRFKEGQQMQNAAPAKGTGDIECPKVQQLIHTIVLQPDQQVPYFIAIHASSQLYTLCICEIE